MRDAVIVEAVRTPVGRRGGVLSGVHPVDLSAHVLAALAERTGIDPAVVDDVIWGCVSQVGEQTFNVGRSAVLAAGWPQSVPGTTIDRQCGSSQQAIAFAAAGLVAGQYDLVVAGGVESMSRVRARVLGLGRRGCRSASGAGPLRRRARGRGHAGVQPGDRRGDDRRALGARPASSSTSSSLESHERAAAAIDEGRFTAQIAPVTLPDGTVVTVDEGFRRGGDARGVGGAQDAVPRGRPDHGRLVVADLRRRRRLAADHVRDGGAAGLRPLARVHTTVVVGDDPVMMLTGPDPGDGEGAGPVRLVPGRHRHRSR